MTTANARKFLNSAITDQQLRDQLNEAPSWDAMVEILRARHLSFTRGEIEEAYNGMLVQSQTEEEAGLIREIKSWWDFLLAAANR